jgi:hypothetical protein
MILIANNDDEYRSAMQALEVINAMRGRSAYTYAIRTNFEDSPWVKTVWPNENYL